MNFMFICFYHKKKKKKKKTWLWDMQAFIIHSLLLIWNKFSLIWNTILMIKGYT